ncbi:MAG: hypothetical protein RR620_10785 [Clostridium sp.]
MTKEMKNLIKRYIQYCAITLIFIFTIFLMYTGLEKSLVLGIGFILSEVSFILTGLMIDKVLVQSKRSGILIIPLKLIILLGVFNLVFKNPTYSSFFIIGFVVPLIISIFSLIKLQRKDV